MEQRLSIPRNRYASEQGRIQQPYHDSAKDFIRQLLEVEECSKHSATEPRQASSRQSKYETLCRDLVLSLRERGVREVAVEIAQIRRKVQVSIYLSPAIQHQVGDILATVAQQEGGVNLLISAARYRVVGNPGADNCGLYAVYDSCGEQISDMKLAREEFHAVINEVQQLSIYLQAPNLDLDLASTLLLVRTNMAWELINLGHQQQFAQQISDDSVRQHELADLVPLSASLAALNQELNALSNRNPPAADLVKRIVELSLHRDPAQTLRNLYKVTPKFADLHFMLLSSLNQQIARYALLTLPSVSLKFAMLCATKEALLSCASSIDLGQLLDDPAYHQVILNNCGDLTMALPELAEYHLTSAGRAGWLHFQEIKALYLQRGFVFEQSCNADSFVLDSANPGCSAVVFINRLGHQAIIRNSLRFSEQHQGKYGCHWEALVLSSGGELANAPSLRNIGLDEVDLPATTWRVFDQKLEQLHLAYQNYRTLAKPIHHKVRKPSAARLVLAQGHALSLSEPQDSREKKLSYLLDNLFFDKVLLGQLSKFIESDLATVVSVQRLANSLSQYLAEQLTSSQTKFKNSEFSRVIEHYNPYLPRLLLQLKSHQQVLRKIAFSDKVTSSYSKLFAVGYILANYATKLASKIKYAEQYSLSYNDFSAWLETLYPENTGVPRIDRSDITAVTCNAKSSFNLGGSYASLQIDIAQLILLYPPMQWSKRVSSAPRQSQKESYLNDLNALRRIVHFDKLPVFSSWSRALFLSQRLLSGYQERFVRFCQILNLSPARSDSQQLKYLKNLPEGGVCSELYFDFRGLLRQLEKFCAQLKDSANQLAELRLKSSGGLRALFEELYQPDAPRELIVGLSHNYVSFTRLDRQVTLLRRELLGCQNKSEFDQLYAQIIHVTAEYSSGGTRQLLLFKELNQRKLRERFMTYFQHYFDYVQSTNQQLDGHSAPSSFTELEQALIKLHLQSQIFVPAMKFFIAADTNPLHANLVTKKFQQIAEVVEVYVRSYFEQYSRIGTAYPELELASISAWLNKLSVYELPLQHLLPLLEYLQSFAPQASLTVLKSVSGGVKLLPDVPLALAVLDWLSPRTSELSMTLNILKADLALIKQLPLLLATGLQRVSSATQLLDELQLAENTAVSLYQLQLVVAGLRDGFHETHVELEHLNLTLRSLQGIGLARQHSFSLLSTFLSQAVASFADYRKLLGTNSQLDATNYVAIYQSLILQRRSVEHGQQCAVVLTDQLEKFYCEVSGALVQLAVIALDSHYQPRCGTLIRPAERAQAFGGLAAKLQGYLKNPVLSSSLRAGYLNVSYLNYLSLIKNFNEDLQKVVNYRSSVVVQFRQQIIVPFQQRISSLISARNQLLGKFPVAAKLSGYADLSRGLLNETLKAINPVGSGDSPVRVPLISMTRFATQLPYNMLVNLLYGYLTQSGILARPSCREALEPLFELARDFEEVYLLHHYYPSTLGFRSNIPIPLRDYGRWFLISYKILNYILEQAIHLDQQQISSGASGLLADGVLLSSLNAYRAALSLPQLVTLRSDLAVIKLRLKELHHPSSKLNPQQILSGEVSVPQSLRVRLEQLAGYSTALNLTLACLDRTFTPSIPMLAYSFERGERGASGLAMLICHQLFLNELIKQLGLLFGSENYIKEGNCHE